MSSNKIFKAGNSLTKTNAESLGFVVQELSETDNNTRSWLLLTLILIASPLMFSKPKESTLKE